MIAPIAQEFLPAVSPPAQSDADRSRKATLRHLRIQIVSGGQLADTALADWLKGHPHFNVRGPDTALAVSLASASTFRPHAVLLDFHGLPVSVGYSVTLFKELSPSPLVYVLTHDASEAMRRRCLGAAADAVFDKTADLELLRQVLTDLRARGIPAKGLPSPLDRKIRPEVSAHNTINLDPKAPPPRARDNQP